MTGIYEQIINQLFRCKLDTIDRNSFYVGEKTIGKEEAILYLSRYLFQIIQKLVSSMQIEEGGIDKSVQLINELIKKIAQELNVADFQDNLIDARASILTAIIDKTSCDYPDIAAYIQQITPVTSLTHSTLFTGSNQAVNMMSELKKEIQSSDEICLLVSFIRQSGLNLLKKELKQFVEKGKILRVITTTYMGASQYSAIRELADLPNTIIKISYNTDLDRLHAKAYLFIRNTGFHTAYIGSSNLSRAALTEGMEWNVKATQVELPHIISTVRHTFDTYWEDNTFEMFRIGVDDERLQKALGERLENKPIDYSVLDLIRAKYYQAAILEKLLTERETHGHYRNLVVAATGTGKTVLAAFDYKRFKENNKKANFLFIVHREEIIKQACSTFRQVLQDENFGEMWYGGCEPKCYSHLFASKDILNNRLDALTLANDYYDYIVFDEAHHITATSYQKIVDKFKPKILLGLTATPERMDGQDITVYFDGRISAEIRLSAALNNRLLVPFHYYGVTDCVDLSEVKWERGHFVTSELSKVYTSNDRRTGRIFDALEKYLPNYHEVRALCFCVDKQHAEYMAAKFTLAGLKAAVMTSDYSQNRGRERKRLERKEINFLFVVDMFNEGVDIPSIDTVLFLRPTESLTVFLQQFGRGLRISEGKEFLTVLDFVGHSRAELNYMDRFRALIGRTTMSVKEEIEKDFPHLPFNCHIELEEKAKTYILENIEARIRSFSKRKIVNAIQCFHKEFNIPLSLSAFIKMHYVPLEKIYKNTTWNSLCLMAGITTLEMNYNSELARAVSKKWLSTDSYSYFSFILKLGERKFEMNEKDLSEKERLMAIMLYYDLFQDADRFESLQQMFNELGKDTLFISELVETMHLLMERCEAFEMDDNSSFRMTMPLKLHGQYTKDQILVALGTSTLKRKSSCREGVERNKTLKLEAMFVDLIKDREAGSTTNYNDFAQSPILFHWETQNSVHEQTLIGQNYINQSQTMLLFVRQQANFPDDQSRTMGYTYLGEVLLVSYAGARPMQIVWKLKTPMPASVFTYAAKYAAIG